MGRTLCFALFVLAIAMPGVSVADDVVVAIPAVRAKRKAAPKTLTQSLRKVFTDAEKKVVTPKNGKPRVLAKVGATHLVQTRVWRQKRRFVIQGELFELGDKRVSLGKSKKLYRGNKGARVAARQVGESLLALLPEPEPEPRAVVPTAPITPTETEAQPEPEPVRDNPADPVPVAPAKADPIVVETEEAQPEAPSDKILMIGVGMGTRALGSYGVTVENTPTNLGYDLDPLLFIAPFIRIDVPATDLGFEVTGGLSPVKWNLDVATPDGGMVDPAQPSGMYLDVALSVLYGIPLSDTFTLEPFISGGYSSLSVDDQTPFDVIVGSTAIVTRLGPRAALDFGALELSLEIAFRALVGYSETPVDSGSAGLGIGFDGGLGIRYWIIDELGILILAGYETESIGMSGAATRQSFLGDPALMDASLSVSAAHAAAGIVFGF